jgi:hypothetical protein
MAKCAALGLVAVICNVAAQIFVKLATSKIQGGALGQHALAAYLSRHLAAALASYAASFAPMPMIFSLFPVGRIVSFMAGANFALVAMAGYFLDE